MMTSLEKMRRKVFKKEATIMHTQWRRPKLIIYIDNETWIDIMASIRGEVDSDVMSLYQSSGKEYLGHKVYRLLSDERHMAVHEA